MSEEFRRIRVFLCGPFSYGEFEKCDRKLCQEMITYVAHKLIGQGFAPMRPYTGFHFGPTRQFDMDAWQNAELAWMRVAEAILLMPGQYVSDLSFRARDFIEQFGVPVFTSVEQLMEAFPDAGKPSPPDTNPPKPPNSGAAGTSRPGN